MKKTIVNTDRAPTAVGPYSQAVIAGELVFTAGQIPLDPATGSLVEGEIERQTERALENLAGVLEAAGSSLDHVLKTTVFLTDMRLFTRVNQVYARYFTAHYPARSCVQVSALPLGVAIEIEAVALIAE